MIPSSSAAVRMIAGMSVRRARRSRMLWLTVAVALLLVGSAAVSLLVGGAGLDFFDDALDVLLRYLVPLVMPLLLFVQLWERNSDWNRAPG